MMFNEKDEIVIIKGEYRGRKGRIEMITNNYYFIALYGITGMERFYANEIKKIEQKIWRIA